jgi:restriction system protein
MAVPTYDTLMLPLLELVRSGDIYHIRDAARTLGEQLALSEADLNELLPNGSKTRFYDRIHWAKTYLTQAGLLEKTGRGLFRITPRGVEVLRRRPPALDGRYLQQFPEFAAFQARSLRPNTEDLPPPVDDQQRTPEEIMVASYQQLQASLASDLLDAVLAASPAFFEQMVIDLLLAMGYGGSLDAGRRIGQSGDGGLDGYIREDKLGLDIIYIQAKRWSPGSTVGRPEVQAFVGSLMGAGSTRGVFITTASFSDKAIEYAASIRTHKIILINGEQLARLLVEHNIGVRVKMTYAIKQIDENYFPDG